MRLIQNDIIAFRCPNSLKEKLEIFAEENDLHVSAIIRKACSDYLKAEASYLFSNPPPIPQINGSGWLISD